MNIIETLTPGQVLIQIDGPLKADYDLILSNCLEQHLYKSNIVIDLEKCTFINSSALGIFLNIHRASKKTGKTLTLKNPSVHADEVLKLTCLDQILNIEN